MSEKNYNSIINCDKCGIPTYYNNNIKYCNNCIKKEDLHENDNEKINELNEKVNRLEEGIKQLIKKIDKLNKIKNKK